jgi:hypothetical protein
MYFHVSPSSENLKERDHSNDLGVDVRIILNGSQGKRVGRFGVDSSGSG